MDILLQRHCAKYIYAVPDGLRELMSDISREVLRNQPENLYTFIADYLDALMITRENARVAARLVEHITEISITIVELLLRTGMTRDQADDIARVIQNAFRRHLRRKEMKRKAEVYGVHEDEDEEGEEGHFYSGTEEEQFVAEVLDEADVEQERRDAAAKIIQCAFRKFMKRQELEKDLLFGMVDWRIAARHTISLFRKAGVTPWEANRAATLIKAAYKGYYTRRVMKRLLEKGLAEEIEEEQLEELTESEYEATFGEEYVEEDEDEQKKSVRINFDTVIPHVDFDDPTVIKDYEPEYEIAAYLMSDYGESGEGYYETQIPPLQLIPGYETEQHLEETTKDENVQPVTEEETRTAEGQPDAAQGQPSESQSPSVEESPPPATEGEAFAHPDLETIKEETAEEVVEVAPTEATTPEVTTEPAPEVTSELPTEVTTEPVTEVAQEPVSDGQPEPVPEVTSEPAPEATPEPVPEEAKVENPEPSGDAQPKEVDAPLEPEQPPQPPPSEETDTATDTAPSTSRTDDTTATETTATDTETEPTTTASEG